jgi:Flp pilus assembly pilin Flp
MTALARLVRCRSGAAAAEMALVLPLLLVLICGCAELGNYFLDEHRLVKAVRDGARYAARQDISNFTACTGNPGGTVVADTQNIVMTGLVSGGNDYLPNRSTGTINVTVDHCSTSVNSTALSGIYSGIKNSGGTVVGAPVVKVEASIPYQPIIHAFGFSGLNLTINASQQAAVMGW